MIRLATLDDSKSVFGLMCDLVSWELSYDVFYDIFKRDYVQGKNKKSYVYEKDGQVLGCVNFRMEDQLHHPVRVAEIMELVVKEDYRSSGIGHALIQKAIDVSIQEGCFRLEVCSNQIREDAHRFYMREGFSNTHYKLTRNIVGAD